MACDMKLKEKNNKENPETVRQKTRLTDLGSLVKGTYEGVVKHVDGPEYGIEIRLFTTTTVVGRDENGEIKTLPKLQAQLRYLDFVYPTDDSLFDVRFNESGNLDLVLSQTLPNGTSQTLASVKSTWKDGEINGDWLSSTGKVGPISLKRVSTKVPEITTIDKRNRRINQYKGVKGLFVGKIFEFSNQDYYWAKLTTTISYDLKSASNLLVARMRLTDLYNGEDEEGNTKRNDNDTLLHNFQFVPVTWDPRTKVFDIDHTIGLTRVLASGILDGNKIHYDVFRIGGKPFDYTDVEQ